MNITESLTFDFISNLPSELSLSILSYLTPQELANTKTVSKNWLDLSNDNVLWKSFFSSIPGKIENLAQAKEYCNFNKKAKSKEELITKIRIFFESFRNHREEAIGLRYQSASSPETSWFYFQHFTPFTGSLFSHQEYFDSIHLKLSIRGYDEADFASKNLQTALPLSSPPLETKFYSMITFNPQPSLVTKFKTQPLVAIYWRNCEVKLIVEIAKECGLPFDPKLLNS